ncbi:MAG TPA: hypothetical protein VJG32_10240 [Anaerolineae bacterium]|nr:hypothetical protein [Anaerolineae bacterium]
MQVVGETVNLVDVLVLLERSDPHWLIVSLLPSGRIPDIIESLLKRHPALHILGVAPDGSRVQIKWQGHEETHDDLSFEDLVRILRARPLLN